jgi:hypothetical protein
MQGIFHYNWRFIKMRKLLLIGLVIAVCMLAFPQGVLAADVPIAATLGSSITFDASGPSDAWALSYNESEHINTLVDGIHLAVTSNDNWSVTVIGNNNGKFTEMGSGGHQLTNPLLISTIASPGSEDWTSTIGSVAIANGVPGIFDVPRSLQQTIVFTDYPSNNYQIILTFTCSAVP